MPDMKECPFCAEEILAVAVKCKHCGEYFDDELHRRRQAPSSAGTLERMLAPVEVSGMSLLSGYMGLFAMFPVIGIIPAIIGIFAGRSGLKEIEKRPNLSGKGRAWFGIISGALFTVIWVIMLISSTLASMSKR